VSEETIRQVQDTSAFGLQSLIIAYEHTTLESYCMFPVKVALCHCSVNASSAASGTDRWGFRTVLHFAASRGRLMVYLLRIGAVLELAISFLDLTVQDSQP